MPTEKSGGCRRSIRIVSEGVHAIELPVKNRLLQNSSGSHTPWFEPAQTQIDPFECSCCRFEWERMRAFFLFYFAHCAPPKAPNRTKESWIYTGIMSAAQNNFRFFFCGCCAP